MNASPKKVLLVEEDATLREIITFRLEMLGHNVVAHESGEAALAWLMDDLPDLVLIGHYLPDMNGLEMIDRLSNEVRTATIPVLVLSPNAELEDVQKAFNAGADEFLVTPFDPLVLERKLKRLVSASLAESEN